MSVTKIKTSWKESGYEGDLSFLDESGNIIMIVESSGREVIFPTGATLTVVDGIAAGNTLDQAYDQGGAGAGKAVTVDSGAIALTNNAANNNGVLAITKDPVGAQSGDAVTITMGAQATGAGLAFANTGSGNDITGSSGWSIEKDGDATFLAVTLAEATNPAGTSCFISRDNTGDVTINALVGKEVHIAIAGTDVVDVSAGGLEVISGGLTVTLGGLTVAASGAAITGDTTITGALTVTGALNWGGVTIISATLTVDELVLDTDGAAPAGTNCYVVRDNGGDITLNAIASKDVCFDINNVTEMSVGDDATVINDSSNDRDFRVEGADTEYMLYMDGGKNSVVIGGNTDVSDNDTTLRISSIAKTITNNNDFAHVWIQPVGSTTLQGTNGIVASFYVAEPDITDPGAATATVATTVYIANAPTEGDANFALYVAAGTVSFLGAAIFNEGSADVDFRVETNGAQYAIYADGGKDSIVLGANADASSADKVVTISRAARSNTAATSFADLWIEPAGTVTTTGVTAVVASIYIAEPNITIGGDSVTVAASLYVAGEPSEGGSNYGIACAAGIGLLADAKDLAIGASADVIMRWSTGDADNYAFAIGLGASLAMHICQAADIATDWNVAADTNPALYIHGATTPATEYLKLWTDETDAHIDAVGAVMRFDIAGTEEMNLNTNALNLCGSTLYGSEAAGGDLILASTSDATEGCVTIPTDHEGLKIGGTAIRAGTAATNVLAIFDGAAPQNAQALVNGIELFSAAGELKVADAAGNQTTLSPHTPDGDYIIHSTSSKKNETITIHLEKLLRALIAKDSSLAQYFEVENGFAPTPLFKHKKAAGLI